MPFNFIKNVILNESTPSNKLELLPLPYSKGDLEPSISEETINYHYSKLAKTYVDRYNAREGDLDFNEAGAFLHNILFPQYKKPDGKNDPDGSASEFITKHFKTFANFKEQFSKVAMGIQGSGWVYMDTEGKLHVIPNHEYKKSMKIALLIDWWEHAWALDYQQDKAKYLTNIWRIIDWDTVDIRLEQSA
jgi:Fe-Mn family superoxide dismutase